MASKVGGVPCHPLLEDVALIDGAAFAAAAGHSISTLHQKVRDGEAPAPVIRRPRFTRWRLADVRAYLQRCVEEGLQDEASGAALIATAKKASDAAQAKRRAVKAG